MKKFYITCGDFRYLLLAVTAIQAAMRSLHHLPTEASFEGVYHDEEVFKMRTMMRVSELGHDKHDDDFVIELTTVLGLIAQNNSFDPSDLNKED